MIQEIVDRYMLNRDRLVEIYTEKHPEDYSEIVKNVITIISNSDSDDDDYDIMPDATRIHAIDYGWNQGTLLYVIAAKGYQPEKYWYVKVCYGSCSACDILKSIKMGTMCNFDTEEWEKPTGVQIKDYMSLSLHIVQGLKEME